MKKFTLVLVATLLVFGATTVLACTTPVPDLTYGAQKFVHQEVLKGTKERIGVVEFKKIDGQRKNTGGVEGYVLYFEAQAQVLQEKCWGRVKPYSLRHFCVNVLSGDPNIELWARGWESKWVNNPKGGRHPIKGRVAFEKRESGWLAVDYRYNLVN